MNHAIRYQPNHLCILHTIRDEAVATKQWRLAYATTILIDEVIGTSVGLCRDDAIRYLDELARQQVHDTSEGYTPLY